jgi:hypothetical protein
MVLSSSLNTLATGGLSKAKISKCLTLVFASRCNSGLECKAAIGKILELDETTAAQVYTDLDKCVDASLTPEGGAGVDGLDELFAQSVDAAIDAKVQAAIKLIISEKREVWDEAASLNRVSLPRYVDMDWAVHIKQMSSEVASIGTPVAMVELQIRDQPTIVGQVPRVGKVDLELSREKLDTMLDGFYRIRDQLGEL